MKHISIAAKISISITERQQNLNTLANFFSEYIINNNVNFQIDVFCWVLGMPPRQSVTAEETQIIDSVTEQENEQNFEPESAPIILLSHLRINQTARSIRRNERPIQLRTLEGTNCRKKYSQKKKPLLLFFELLNLTSFCIGNKSEGQCFIERRM